MNFANFSVVREGRASKENGRPVHGKQDLKYLCGSSSKNQVMVCDLTANKDR